MKWNTDPKQPSSDPALFQHAPVTATTASQLLQKQTQKVQRFWHACLHGYVVSSVLDLHTETLGQRPKCVGILANPAINSWPGQFVEAYKLPNAHQVLQLLKPQLPADHTREGAAHVHRIFL